MSMACSSASSSRPSASASFGAISPRATANWSARSSPGIARSRSCSSAAVAGLDAARASAAVGAIAGEPAEAERSRGARGDGVGVSGDARRPYDSAGTPVRSLYPGRAEIAASGERLLACTPPGARGRRDAELPRRRAHAAAQARALRSLAPACHRRPADACNPCRSVPRAAPRPAIVSAF
jgi:hypothetical protein